MADKLEIGVVLDNIDSLNANFYNVLPDEEKKLFQPYVVLRWMAALNDSVVLKYRASEMEAVTGKWKDTGKDVCKQIVEAVNNLAGSEICTGVTKSGDQNTRAWYIVFSVRSATDATSTANHIRTLTSLSPTATVVETETDVYKNCVLATNEFVNVGFWDINKHPELQYKLMCVAGAYTVGAKKARSWIPMIGGTNSNISSILSFFKVYYDDPCMREDEARLILKQLDKDTFIYMIESSGLVEQSEYKRFIAAYDREKI